MRQLQRWLVALMVAASAGVVVRPATERQSAFAVAVLRRDGVLVPIATYSSGKWSNPWPLPNYRFEVPLNVSSIPRNWWGRLGPSLTWVAWPLRGEPRTLHVTSPVVIPAHCLSNVGLRTDYKASEPIPPPTQSHHPKDGLATTGSEAVVPIDVLDEKSPDWAPTLKVITASVEKAEMKAAAADPFGMRRRPYGSDTMSASRRAGAPLRLDVLCRSRSSRPGATVYYVEASRRYAGLPADNKRACEVVIVTRGFILLDDSRLGRAEFDATLTDCDLQEVEFGLPLGSMFIEGKMYWIMQWAGFGRERYSVVEVGTTGVRTVLDVPGGAC